MFITRIIAEKRRWRQYEARKRALPAPYRDTLEALQRYLFHAGGMDRSDVILRLFDDLTDLFEQAAADGTPVAQVVGDDPVDFIEEFLKAYPEGLWVNRERDRLTRAIDRVRSGQAG
jgi:DNA-binding ferritin-like protein (Dps family)